MTATTNPVPHPLPKHPLADSADAHPPPPHRPLTVAHTVATHRTPTGPHHNLNAARQAITTGLDADPTAELLYRDWLRIESAAGNRQGLHTAITRIQQVNQALDCDLEWETVQLINELLNGPGVSERSCKSVI